MYQTRSRIRSRSYVGNLEKLEPQTPASSRNLEALMIRTKGLDDIILNIYTYIYRIECYHKEPQK